MDDELRYRQKYLKYKQKYDQLMHEQSGGATGETGETVVQDTMLQGIGQQLQGIGQQLQGIGQQLQGISDTGPSPTPPTLTRQDGVNQR